MDVKRIAVGLAPAILVLIGALTNSWWSASGIGAEAHLGLRSVEICFVGECDSIPLSGPLDRGVWSLAADITFFGGLLAAFAMMASAVIREITPTNIASRTALSLSGLMAVSAIVTVLSLPGQAGSDLSLSWSFFVYLIGCGSGLFIHANRDSGGWTGTKYVPLSASPQPIIRTETPAEPAPPPDRVEHRDSYRQLEHEARKLPKKVKGIGKGRSAANVASASADVARKNLRFAAANLAIGRDGFTVQFEDGGKRGVPWAAIREAIARRMPPDPPFEKLIFVDLVLADGAPIRLLPSTRGNYDALPGQGSTSRENLRRLVARAREMHPGLAIEPESRAFFDGGGTPPEFAAIKQFADYDARY